KVGERGYRRPDTRKRKLIEPVSPATSPSTPPSFLTTCAFQRSSTGGHHDRRKPLPPEAITFIAAIRKQFGEPTSAVLRETSSLPAPTGTANETRARTHKRHTQNEIKPATLFTAINRQGVPFLWPVPIAMTDARILEWHRSLREAAERAMDKWVRVQANMDLGAYEMFEATGVIPDPDWPDLSFLHLLRIAFRDRIVDRLDHPVVKRLHGA